MTVYNEDVRVFLLKKGFVPLTNAANDYELVYSITNNNHKTLVTFNVQLDKCKATAVYPDKVYNAQNTYSPRDCKVEFNWNSTDMSEVIITNLEAFFDKIIKINI